MLLIFGDRLRRDPGLMLAIKATGLVLSILGGLGLVGIFFILVGIVLVK